MTGHAGAVPVFPVNATRYPSVILYRAVYISEYRSFNEEKFILDGEMRKTPNVQRSLAI